MYLKKLEIELGRYGKDKGKYTGRAIFDNELGVVSLNLTPEMCDEIFKVCADGIITTAKEAANNLTCAVIEHQEKLENT